MTKMPKLCINIGYGIWLLPDETKSLTHWGRVTHICINKLTIIGSDNGLSPGRRQAIIWTNVVILLTGPFGTNCSEILIKIFTFSFRKMYLKMLSGKWGHFVSASMYEQTQHCLLISRIFGNTPCCVEFHCFFCHLLTPRWHSYSKTFLKEHKDPFFQEVNIIIADDLIEGFSPVNFSPGFVMLVNVSYF